MTLKHIVTDLHQVYLTEMEAKIKPKSTAGTEKKSDSEGGTAEDQVKKAARQLAYDTRYKARRDGLPLERAFTQTLQNSSASGPVKELAKGMLFGGGQKEEVEKISEKPELPPEVFAALRRLENKRQRQGGDKKDSPFPSDRKKEVKKESIGTAIDKTLGAAGEVADTAVKFPAKAVGYAAGLKKGLKKQFKKGQGKANEETLHEISADTGLKAVKAADAKRAQLAKAGDKEGAASKAAQAKRLYDAQARKRLKETISPELTKLIESGKFSEQEINLLVWNEFEESREYSHNPEKYHDSEGHDKKLERDKPYRKRSKAARMADPERGINSPAFKKFMADRGL